MKLRLLLGLALSGLFCGCGSSGGGGQTVTPNSSRRTASSPMMATRQRIGDKIWTSSERL